MVLRAMAYWSLLMQITEQSARYTTNTGQLLTQSGLWQSSNPQPHAKMHQWNHWLQDPGRGAGLFLGLKYLKGTVLSEEELLHGIDCKYEWNSCVDMQSSWDLVWFVRASTEAFQSHSHEKRLFEETIPTSLCLFDWLWNTIKRRCNAINETTLLHRKCAIHIMADNVHP